MLGVNMFFFFFFFFFQMVGIASLPVFIGRSRLFSCVAVNNWRTKCFCSNPGVSSSPNVLGIAFFINILCVCVSLVCGKKRRRWRRKTVNVTRWHFWNNKVTACRWQLSLVLSLSDLCGTIAPFFHIAQRNDVEKKRRKRSLVSSSILPSSLFLSSYVWPFFFRLFSLDQTQRAKMEHKRKKWMLISTRL